MDQDQQDREEIQDDERTTIAEARRRAGAEAGTEPTASAEADEPTTAAADRVRPEDAGMSEPP